MGTFSWIEPEGVHILSTAALVSLTDILTLQKILDQIRQQSLLLPKSVNHSIHVSERACTDSYDHIR